MVVARYELALEATRRPELRAPYDLSLIHIETDPERHALSMIAWCDGVLFSCTAGQYHAAVPSRAALRTSCAELLNGMLPSRPE